MFIRQKLVLNLLNLLSEDISSLKLQKLFFLYSLEEREKKSYEFIPYNYGCYSFTLQQDELQLEKKKLIEIVRPTHSVFSNISLNCDLDLPEISTDKNNLLCSIVNRYKDYSDNELIEITYNKKPYYSKNIEFFNQFADGNKLIEDIARINYKIENRGHFLYTIGYEKKSIELFINKLIFYNIKKVIDIRSNAYSMKSNFIGATLRRLLEKVNIDYVHIPELGISSKDRKAYIPQGKRDQLFEIYYESLKTKIDYVNEVIAYYKKENIALMCFELNPLECHRLQLANYCKRVFDNNISIKHI